MHNFTIDCRSIVLHSLLQFLDPFISCSSTLCIYLSTNNDAVRKFKEEDERRSMRARRASKEYKRQSIIASDPQRLTEIRMMSQYDNVVPMKTKPPLPTKPKHLKNFAQRYLLVVNFDAFGRMLDWQTAYGRNFS